MTHYKTDRLDLRLMDCMDLMRGYPDKHFELCISDPPYGLGDKLVAGGTWSVKYQGKGAKWDVVPEKEFFDEMMRVSKNWIVWGGNYFTQYLPPARCFAIWRKPHFPTMADCELALTSFDENAKVFDSVRAPDEKIHVCQKPVALYRWLLANYAKAGDKILDTHLGSMSSCIAAHYAGLHLTGCELDPDYFAAGINRVKRETAQMDMFSDAPNIAQPETLPLL